MLMPREPLRDRLSRRMTEQKNAKLAAAEKNPRPRVRSAKAKAVDDQRAVKDELRAVDQHAAVLRRQMEKRPEGPAAFGLWGDERRHELEVELRQLAALRKEIKHDVENPIMRDRDGRPLTARQRAFGRMRTREIAEQLWKQAARAESAGEHRRARRCRLDALRARQLAEGELGLRRVRGYDFAG
jgi:hypothetical protein